MKEEQKVVSDGSEKGLESLGRPTNDYFKNQYSKNDKAIGLKSDGKDYSNVDFGENVGDEVLKKPLTIYGREFITKEERNNAELILSTAAGKKYEVDWVKYDNILETNYRAKINYLVYQEMTRVKDLYEMEDSDFKETLKKEAVYHNYNNQGKVIINSKFRNRKFVSYSTGKEVIISSNFELIKNPVNVGTGNWVTYGLITPEVDEGKYDKLLHGVDIVSYILGGTGVNDNSTILQRTNKFILASFVSINYDILEKWAEKKGYDSIGYKELYEYYLKDNMLELIEERQNRLLNKIGTGDAK